MEKKKIFGAIALGAIVGLVIDQVKKTVTTTKPEATPETGIEPGATHAFKVNDFLRTNSQAVSQQGWSMSNDGNTKIPITSANLEMGNVIALIRINGELGYRVNNTRTPFHPIRTVREKWVKKQ